MNNNGVICPLCYRHVLAPPGALPPLPPHRPARGLKNNQVDGPNAKRAQLRALRCDGQRVEVAPVKPVQQGRR